MKDSEQLSISRQLATLICSGLPLLDAIKLMEFRAIEQDLNQGQSLSYALEKLGFHTFCVGLIKTGEASGNLHSSLLQINTYLDKKIKLRKKVAKALLYPSLVLGISLLVLWAMFNWVIPSFENMFKNFNAQLPLPTLVLIDISNWVKSYSVFLLIFISTCCLIFIKLWSVSKSLQQRIDRMVIKLPIIGRIRKSALVTQWARNTGILYGHGIPILDALRETALNSNDWVIWDFCAKLRVLLSQGQSFSSAVAMIDPKYILINKEYLQLIKISETSGDLGRILVLIADQEEEALDQLIDQLTQSLEPFLMLFMGLIIGSLVISLYLPIFEMGQIL